MYICIYTQLRRIASIHNGVCVCLCWRRWTGYYIVILYAAAAEAAREFTADEDEDRTDRTT